MTGPTSGCYAVAKTEVAREHGLFATTRTIVAPAGAVGVVRSVAWFSMKVTVVFLFSGVEVVAPADLFEFHREAPPELAAAGPRPVVWV